MSVYKYGAVYTTLHQYKENNPQNNTAIQILCVSEHGEIHSFYFYQPTPDVFIGNIITDYVFINGWTVSFKDIKVS